MFKMISRAIFILIFSVISSYSVAHPLTVICNNDKLTCGSFGSDKIEIGLLPLALQRLGIEDAKFIDYTKGYLQGIDFDLAVTTSKQAQMLNKDKQYEAISIPLKNQLVKLSLANSQSHKLANVGVCRFDSLNTDCLPISKAVQQFNEGKANLVLYRSQLEGIERTLMKLDYEESVISDMTYVLLIKPDSPLLGLGLATEIISPESLSGTQWSLIVLALVILVAICMIIYTTYSAKIDEHSGCLNKQAFEKRSGQNIPQNTTIMLIDYNNFKSVNDTFGHETGDRVIERVSSEIIKILRKGDQIYRIGGDEFFIEFSNSLPETRIEQIRNNLNEAAKKVSEELNLTNVNFGLSIGHKHVLKGSSYKKAYAAVDKEMYHQKRLSKVSR